MEDYYRDLDSLKEYIKWKVYNNLDATDIFHYYNMYGVILYANDYPWYTFETWKQCVRYKIV